MAAIVAPPAAIVSEAARERETFRYDSLEPNPEGHGEETPQQLIPTSILTSSPDPALTAFAQLGLLRLEATRALVSLFDRHHQHIVAEAQRDNEQPWLVGVAVPRSTSICEHVIIGPGPVPDLPVSVIPDLRTDDRFAASVEDPAKRFYAGIPIRSPAGINIGVFCVFDDVPRPAGLGHEAVRFMQDLSQTIMTHLDTKRASASLRREKGMIRGLGSFVEGRMALSLAGEPPAKAARAHNATSPKPSSTTSLKRSVDYVFSKAANIIRESLAVEGVLFVDATVRSFGGLVGREMTSPAVLGKANSSSDDEGSSDESPGAVPFETMGEEGTCDVLGFSTSKGGSIDGHAAPAEYSELKEVFLQRLLRRFPHGKIFTYEADGSAHSDQSSSEIEESVPGQPPLPPTTTRSHLNAASTIIKLFPGARSVAVVPLWDGQRNRWFAGGFFWSTRRNRVFSVEQEISFLRVFGLTAMAEVARLNTRASDKTKTDILGSISHELRSPLHGVVGAVELLRHTRLDDYQENIVRTIQTSGRTLLDTIDHLLDHSKMNHFAKAPKAERRKATLGHLHGDGRTPARTPARQSSGSGSGSGSGGGGETDLQLPPVQLDGLLEEIVETVLASYSFSYRTTSSGSYVTSPMSPNVHKRLHLDSSRHFPASGYPANVTVLLDIEYAPNWCFCAHPGAIRRIVMNLLGNSLKFTRAGHIRIRARQERVGATTANITISVEDSGKGMSEDYLRNHLFNPFSQEDHFAPGTGLGLSLVRKMTSSLGGNINVSSRLGQGTTISVVLPLAYGDSSSAAPSDSDDDEEHFKMLQDGLRGKTIRIGGPETTALHTGQASSGDSDELNSQLDLLADACRNWLGMDVLTNTSPEETPMPEQQQQQPDFVISTGILAGHLFQPNPCPHIVLGDIVPSSLASPGSTASTFVPAKPNTLSSPIGPRKLAVALTNARRRWLMAPSLSSPGPAPGTGATTQLDWIPKDAFETVSPAADSPDGMVGIDSSSSVQTNGDAVPSRPSLARGSSSFMAPPSGPAGALPAEKPVLVVDDNAINLKILTAYMRRINLQFVTATNGMELWERYQAEPDAYRCVLTDISMPIMNGLEATQRIRKLEREKGIKPVPLIALTGLGGQGLEQDAYASGVDLVLTKPVSMAKITGALKKIGVPVK